MRRVGAVEAEPGRQRIRRAEVARALGVLEDVFNDELLEEMRGLCAGMSANPIHEKVAAFAYRDQRRLAS